MVGLADIRLPVEPPTMEAPPFGLFSVAAPRREARVTLSGVTWQEQCFHDAR